MRNKLNVEKHRIIKTLTSFKNIIQGTIVMRKHTCGKSNCRCKRHDKFLHTSHQLTFAIDGKTKTITIPKDKIKDVEQGILQYKSFRQQVKQLLEINRNLIRKNPYQLKE